ncbi:MAG: adenylate/guanylate cyclase domain-containing protein [Verrucomicrobiota bacterium]
MNDPEASGALFPTSQELAAVMFTDVVSFSSQMHADEAKTLADVKRDMSYMKELAETYNGRVFKRLGDGMLLHFKTAGDAVRCGVAFQQAMVNGFGPEDSPSNLQHRVGIHLGDMYVSESEVMGDSVNIASRLQSIAEPGGICISQTVYEIVKNKLSVKAIHLGQKELKNIAQAIDVYRILVNAVDEEPPVTKPSIRFADRLAQWKSKVDPGFIKHLSRPMKLERLAEQAKEKRLLVTGLALLALLVLGLGIWGMTWGIKSIANQREAAKAETVPTLSRSQVERAISGKTISLGQFLGFTPTGEIKRKAILGLKQKSINPITSNDGKTLYQAQYSMTYQVRGDGRYYSVYLTYNESSYVTKVRITGPHN